MKHLEGLSDDKLMAYAKRRMPVYRKLMARLDSFMFALFGVSRGRNAATASEAKIDVSGDGGLRTVDRISLNTFKAPSFNKMKQHVAVLQDSSEIDELEYMIDRFAKSESTEIRRQSKAMIPMLAAMQETFNRAHEALENLAEKHLPKEVGDVFQSAQKEIVKMMQAYTGEDNVTVASNILIGAEHDQIDFVQYFELTEHVENKLWLMVTCSLTGVGQQYVMSTHVAAQDRFQGPMNFDVGESVSLANLGKALRTELSINGVIIVSGAVTLKLDETRLRKALGRLDFVSEVRTSNKAVNVWVKGNKKTFDQEKEIFAILSSDADIRKLMGRSRRLISEWNDADKFWTFSVIARS